MRNWKWLRHCIIGSSSSCFWLFAWWISSFMACVSQTTQQIKTPDAIVCARWRQIKMLTRQGATAPRDLYMSHAIAKWGLFISQKLALVAVDLHLLLKTSMVRIDTQLKLPSCSASVHLRPSAADWFAIVPFVDWLIYFQWHAYSLYSV